MEERKSFKQLFKNKKILVTGHTGFKGSWLSAWLHLLGAEVHGISLKNPPSEPSHFDVGEFSKFVKGRSIDIRISKKLSDCIIDIKPDFVFHLAAQSIVKRSYEDPVETFHVNALGTLNLLEALRLLQKKCSVVLITSDKCYNNFEWVWGYRETDSLGGKDPYSASKGSAELVISSHLNSFFPTNGIVRIGVGRAGNVIGGGDWSHDRIVPDCVRSWAKKESVKLRNPQATRPWQHVLEPLSGYLSLAKGLHEKRELHGEPFNFGPISFHNYSVKDLVQEMSKYWDQVNWENVSEKGKIKNEAGLLKLNCDKALFNLDWKGVLSFKETIRMTVEWYKSYYRDSTNICSKTFSQINEYEALAQKRGLKWAL